MHFCELDRKEYDAFQKNHEYCNFLNGVETMDLEVSEGYSGCYVGIKENNAILCAIMLVKMPTLKKFYFYYAPRGLLIDYKNKELVTYFSKELKKYARSKGIIYIICDPYVLYKERDNDGVIVADGFDHSYVIKALKDSGFIHQGLSIGYGHNMQWVRWMYSMSLQSKTKESLWKDLHQQTRWSINKTLKYQMQVRELGYDELNIFHDIMVQTGERRQFESRGIEFYQKQMKAYDGKLKVLLAYLDVSLYRRSINEELEKELLERQAVNEELEKVNNSKKFIKKLKVVEEAIETAHKRLEEADLLEKEHGNIIPMAVSMFILYGDEVTYLTSGAYEEFRGFYASYAIQWHMINDAIKQDYPKYNFYGISGEFDEASPNYGVYKFKRGFPGQVEELVGDFIMPVRGLLFKIYQSIRKVR